MEYRDDVLLRHIRMSCCMSQLLLQYRVRKTGLPVPVYRAWTKKNQWLSIKPLSIWKGTAWLTMLQLSVSRVPKLWGLQQTLLSSIFNDWHLYADVPWWNLVEELCNFGIGRETRFWSRVLTLLSAHCPSHISILFKNAAGLAYGQSNEVYSHPINKLC